MGQEAIGTSLAGSPAANRHFTAGELRHALAAGLSDPDRWRAILHFGRRRCDRCWNLLKRLAAGELLPQVVEGSPGRGFDSVLAALWRLIVAYRSPAIVDQLRPVHRFWLGHSRLQDFGFLRLMLEESRQYALEHPASGLVVARSTLDLLAQPNFEDLGRRWTDLRALARAYLGDEHRAAGDPTRARRQLAAAEQGLWRGTGDPELRATWLELKAELEQAGGQYTLALGLLDEALELLRPLEIEGRSTETRVLLGLVRLRSGNDRGAGDAFRQALSDMPPGKTQRLRLKTLLYLALAEVRSRRFNDARRNLAAASKLEDSYATQLLQAQRLWIEGILHLETRSYGDAEEPLRQSLQRFLMLGRVLDAAQVLAGLGRLYAVTQRTAEFEGLDREFDALLQAPATRKWVLALREQVVRWAEEAGRTLRSSSELLTGFDGDPKKWIH